MDFQEIKQRKMKKLQELEDEKMKTVYRRQVRIFNKEKETYTRKSSNNIKKINITLGFLRQEVPIKLDDYLATQSEVIERKYNHEEAIVKGLVNTTSIVKGLLADEIESNKKLTKQIDKIKAAELHERKEDTLREVESQKFRTQDRRKMNGRIQQASTRYHMQRQKNMILQDKIDNALIVRDIYLKEEDKLDMEINALQQMVFKIMKEASQLYEERDRMEGTRLKLQEHLTKVKENCVKELQLLTSTLIEDKEIESFMRIKQRDIGGYIRERRVEEKNKIKEMLKQRDEYSLIFDRIKHVLSKQDMSEILTNFIHTEEENFAIFLAIGELMVESETLRCTIRDMSLDNVTMETVDLEGTHWHQDSIQEIKNRTSILRHSRTENREKINKDEKMLEDFYNHVKSLIRILQMDTNKIKQFNGGVLTTYNVKIVLTSIEEEMASLIDDFTMIEIATRASLIQKSTIKPDEAMVIRKPSIHIKHVQTPKFHALSVSRHSDTEMLKDTRPMSHSQVKDVVYKGIYEGGEKLDARRGTHYFPGGKSMKSFPKH